MKSAFNNLLDLPQTVIYRQEFYTLFLIFVTAFAIRVIGIDWGLHGQNNLHSIFEADEPGILFASLSLGEGHYLNLLQNYPFFYYLSSLVLAFYYLVGLITGIFADWADLQAQYAQDVSQFLLVGRYFVAVITSFTVVATYFVGRKMFNKQVAWLAAVFMLFSFGHVIYSKIFRLDGLLPLVFLIGFYFIIVLTDVGEGRLRPYVLCGLSLAIAVATKVTAWALLIPFLMIPFITQHAFTAWPRRSQIRPFVFSAVILFSTYFALIAPNMVRLAEVTEAVVLQLDKSGSIGNPSTLSPYAYSIVWHIRHILPDAMSLALYILALAGLCLMLFDRQKRAIILLLYVTLFAYLLPIGYASRTTWRDILPLLPFLYISAAYALNQMLPLIFTGLRLERPLLQKTVMAAIVIGLLVAPVQKIYAHQYLISQKDTRDIARDWIEANIPDGSNIAMETYGPTIRSQEYQARIEVYEKQSSYLDALSPPVYNISLFEFGITEGRLLDGSQFIPYLLANKVEYVIVSSAYYGRFYNDAIDVHFPEIGAAGREVHDLIESNLHLLMEVIPDRHHRPGPIIKIYQVPGDLTSNWRLERGSFDPFPGMERPASAVGYYEFWPR